MHLTLLVHTCALHSFWMSHLWLVEDTVAHLPPAAVTQGGLGGAGAVVVGKGEITANHRFYSNFGKEDKHSETKSSF